MGFSRRKPYHYLKDSHSSFMRRHVRWLRDIYTRESFLEKPYLADGRAEMHMEMPKFIFPLFPPYPKWWIPPPTIWPPIIIPPPTPLPKPKPWPKIEWPVPIDLDKWPPDEPPIDPPLPPPIPSPWPPPRPGPIYPPPKGFFPPGDDGSGGGIRVLPNCRTSGMIPDCVEEGDLFIVRTQLQSFGEYPEWRIVSSNPGLVKGTLLATWSGQATFLIEILGEIDPEFPAFICIYAIVKKRGFEGILDIDCGCFELAFCCPADPPLTWDEEGSDETIVREGSAAVYVLGGQPPFTWSVSGIGFSFATSVTQGRANLLEADNTTCGSADITVTDGCEETATGAVREEDNSKWSAIAGDVCIISGAANWVSYGIQDWKLDGTLIQGKYKSVVRMGGAYGSNGCVTCGSSVFPGAITCSEYCATANCSLGCEECLTGFIPKGDYTQAGAWNCWGKTPVFPSCDAGLYRQLVCACPVSILNYEWVCN